MNPIVLICTHNRVAITQKNIDLLSRQDCKIILVRSDPSELFQVGENVHILECDNHPLGFKWQCGVLFAETLKADPLIICGSDDFLASDYVDLVCKYMNMGVEFIGLTSWYTFDVEKDIVYHCEYTNFNRNFPIGSGKALSGGLLDRIGWKMFENHLNRKLDDFSFYGAKTQGAAIHLIRNPEVLAVKGDWPTLNPVGAYLKSRNILTRRVNKEILSHFAFE